MIRRAGDLAGTRVGRLGAAALAASLALVVTLAIDTLRPAGADEAAKASGVAPASGVAALEGADAIERGRLIVGLGNGRDGSACAACHGFDGNGDPSGAFPRLAGQQAAYLRKALERFASGVRANALMSPIAKNLTQAERADVAAYYASLRSPTPPSHLADPAVIAKGELLAVVGSNEAQIPACSTCHGPFGRSTMAELPSLAGQYESYIVHELELFRDGRRGFAKGFMHNLAGAMSEAEMHDVAAYFRRQPPAGALR